MFSWWRLCFSGAIIPYIVYEQFHFFFFASLFLYFLSPQPRFSLFSTSLSSSPASSPLPCLHPLSSPVLSGDWEAWCEGGNRKGGCGGGVINPKMNQALGSETHISPLSLSLSSGTEGCGDEVGSKRSKKCWGLTNPRTCFYFFSKGAPLLNACK